LPLVACPLSPIPSFCVISLSLLPRSRRWITVSFPSTLHLYPILDVLLARIPKGWHPEIRLGLQEALVNAAKHGNNLDPKKSVSIRFSASEDGYYWVISDEGNGFCPEQCLINSLEGETAGDPALGIERDCGRGLLILHYIFDQVQWNATGTQLTLHKRTKRCFPFTRCLPFF